MSISLWIDIEEIFAQWFDFSYIFNRNLNRYYSMIWPSWLRWDRIWNFKKHYLFRSFLIYLLPYLEELRDVRNRSYPDVKDYLVEKFHEMGNLISSLVPPFRDYIKDVKSSDIENFPRLADEMEAFLSFLQLEYFDEELNQRINADYPDELLNKHSALLSSGYVITEPIPNPIRLLIELHSSDQLKDPPLKVSTATILTMWNNYIRNYCY